MIGGIVMLIGMYLTGEVASWIIRKIKTKHPSAFQKHLPLMAVASILMVIWGFCLSSIVGSLINGSTVSFSNVLAISKLFTIIALFVTSVHLLRLAVERIVTNSTKQNRKSDKQKVASQTDEDPQDM